MVNADGKIVCEAESAHCFVDTNGRPIRLAKQFPDFDKTLKDLAAQNMEE